MSRRRLMQETPREHRRTLTRTCSSVHKRRGPWFPAGPRLTRVVNRFAAVRECHASLRKRTHAGRCVPNIGRGSRVIVVTTRFPSLVVMEAERVLLRFVGYSALFGSGPRMRGSA